MHVVFSSSITLFSFTFVALLGTALDLLYVRTSNLVVQRQSPLKRCLLAFSVPRNFASVFQTKTGDSNLGCLHGVRFLTMGWVVMGHTYALTNHQTFGTNIIRTRVARGLLSMQRHCHQQKKLHANCVIYLLG